MTEATIIGDYVMGMGLINGVIIISLLALTFSLLLIEPSKPKSKTTKYELGFDKHPPTEWGRDREVIYPPEKE